MDKNWVHKPIISKEYDEGLKTFIDYGSKHGKLNQKGHLKCPCSLCCNTKYVDRDTLYDHLSCRKMIKHYSVWFHHGEKEGTSSTTVNIVDESNDGEDDNDIVDDMSGMLHDAFGVVPSSSGDDIDGSVPEIHNLPDASAAKFYNLVEDMKKELYPGCKSHTLLSFVIKLWHIKCLGGWSNKAFSMLLDLLREAYPDSILPENFTQSKKVISDLGLNYDKIDACPNDCMLYWKENSKKEICHTCEISRWKNPNDGFNKKKPAKILRHFPLKSRLQRLYMSSKVAEDMRWHDVEHTKDGVLRHPADSEAWQDFDKRHPTFAADSRNVRLGLATDGFNPFRTMSIVHSTWPVIVMPYNLPPWLCMKQPNMIMSLLISGPCGPGNDIDVYLRPLINELKELWEEGVDTYDSLRKEMFKLRAALMWTISDFPGYAMLSGWSTKGKLACPTCHEHTCSQYLKNGRKLCYMGHRRFLPDNHRFRKLKNDFDGTVEDRAAPTPLSGREILEKLKDIPHVYGKQPIQVDSSEPKRPRVSKSNLPANFKKLSIFYELIYWKDNKIRHNFDPMHVEKNVSDSVIGTLLELDGKSKDSLKARLDLVEMGIRHDLHPTSEPGNKLYIPSACYSMDKFEKEMFCSVLKDAKTPDGYSSNFSRCVKVKERKIFGLKSHDHHVIMQQYIALAVRKTLPKEVAYVLIELGTFFRELCSKTSRATDFERLGERIPVILSKLERIFPPAFFDVMAHIPVHLASEAAMAGPVHYRWMYPIERYLYTLKSYVRNRAQPEGSIAEGYLADECLTFCSRYLQNVETRLNRPPRYHEDSVIGGTVQFILNSVQKKQIHNYVLFNDENVVPYIGQHKSSLRMRFRKRVTPHEQQNMHRAEFGDWFKKQIQIVKDSKGTFHEGLDCLAAGPFSQAKRYTGYFVNGYKFKTFDSERSAKSQNSGVVVDATIMSYASPKDPRPVGGELTYYGRLIDIVEVTYPRGVKFVLFKCDWVDVEKGKGIKTDELGFTLVNFNHLLTSHSETYVLASQVKQVMFSKDPIEPEWHVIAKNKPRDTFDMGGDDDQLLDDDQPYGNEHRIDDEADDNLNLVRTEVTGATIDAPPTTSLAQEDTPMKFVNDDEGEGEGEEYLEDEMEESAGEGEDENEMKESAGEDESEMEENEREGEDESHDEDGSN